MVLPQQGLNPDGHSQTCQTRPGGVSDTSQTHNDIFCEGCHDWFDKPHILPNGTDIAWPAGWGRAQAQQWRQAQGLEKPQTLRQAGPHDRQDLTNDAATAGTGMLPEPGTANDSDMAPGG